jgi:hypothetical protein
MICKLDFVLIYKKYLLLLDLRNLNGIYKRYHTLIFLTVYSKVVVVTEATATKQRRKMPQNFWAFNPNARRENPNKAL